MGGDEVTGSGNQDTMSTGVSERPATHPSLPSLTLGRGDSGSGALTHTAVGTRPETVASGFTSLQAKLWGQLPPTQRRPRSHSGHKNSPRPGSLTTAD